VSNQANNSRRKFIKTTGAVAGITVIPTSSVWGACNATGISGGSKALDVVCQVPTISGGWSPGSWKKLTKKAACNKMDHAKKKFKKIFGDTSDSMLNSYIAGMANFLATETVTFGDGTTCEQISFNIAEVFDKDVTGDSMMDLAAMYLNIYFGLAEWDTTLNSTGALVMEDFWGSMCVEHGTESSSATPRWSAPSGNALSRVIGDQYWDDNDMTSYGDTSKISLAVAALNCS